MLNAKKKFCGYLNQILYLNEKLWYNEKNSNFNLKILLKFENLHYNVT